MSIAPQSVPRPGPGFSGGPTPGPPGATTLGRVEAAVEALNGVASLPLQRQVSVYAEAHRALQETLGTIEER
ncbi:hypothetical protein [Dactylosporangium sp. NPDC005555]|uniref:hypothetical protein n=1 Tax=Dactylosporangium sp. NPDC005555 TaxID=3154889 RepID=UPI0033BF30BC